MIDLVNGNDGFIVERGFSDASGRSPKSKSKHMVYYW